MSLHIIYKIPRCRRASAFSMRANALCHCVCSFVFTFFFVKRRTRRWLRHRIAKCVSHAEPSKSKCTHILFAIDWNSLLNRTACRLHEYARSECVFISCSSSSSSSSLSLSKNVLYVPIETQRSRTAEWVETRRAMCRTFVSIVNIKEEKRRKKKCRWALDSSIQHE